jgi:hypothetical protein
MAVNRVELGSRDVLVYKGKDIDRGILEAIIDTDKRVLWAFIENAEGTICAFPYSENEVIWMEESDVLREQDVEI